MIIGSEYIFFENLPSTNNYASVLLKNQFIQEGTIIHTKFQTAGKGVAGNRWESEPGKNLLFSIILCPVMIKPEDQFIISKAVSLGILDYLKQYTDKVSIKWPNDIYANDDKIAGILIETTIIGSVMESAIAGIGLNINQKVFLSDTPNPVSLSNLTNQEYDLEEALFNLVYHLNRRYNQLFEGYLDVVEKDYLVNLYRAGIYSQFRDTDGTFRGKIDCVNSSGLLSIIDESGKYRYYRYKEVIFL